MRTRALFITIPSLIAAVSGPVYGQVEAAERGIRVNGRPLFPIGLFCVGWTAEDSPAALADAARLGCNTVHSYWAADIARSTETVRGYLDEAARLGLKVTPTLGDYRTPREAVATGNDAPLREAMKRMVGPLKDHPALLAWYVWDEPNVGVLAAPPEVVRAASDAVKREDPDHPTFFCFTPWHSLDRIDSYGACCDILAVDPYVRAKYMGLVSESVRAARGAAGPSRPVWSIIWASQNAGQKIPLVADMRCATYLSLIHGATGIFFCRTRQTEAHQVGEPEQADPRPCGHAVRRHLELERPREKPLRTRPHRREPERHASRTPRPKVGRVRRPRPSRGWSRDAGHAGRPSPEARIVRPGVQLARGALVLRGSGPDSGSVHLPDAWLCGGVSRP